MIAPREFNQTILALAPPHVAHAHAPSTWAELLRDQGALVRTVSPNHCDATIYGDASVNLAFRAWHDATHLSAQQSFTLEGERNTCKAQVRHMLTAYPRAPRSVIALLWVEIVGQAEYLAAAGTFPIDQRLFVSEYAPRLNITALEGAL